MKLHQNWNPHGVLVWWKTRKISWQPFTIKQIDLFKHTNTNAHLDQKQHLGGETVIPAESISQIPDSSSIEPPGPPHRGGSCHLQSNRPCVPFLQGCGLSCLLRTFLLYLSFFSTTGMRTVCGSCYHISMKGPTCIPQGLVLQSTCSTSNGTKWINPTQQLIYQPKQSNKHPHIFHK